jgi:peptide/nickel transport system substrate-binding protein
VIPPDDESSSVGEPSRGPGSQTDTSRDADVHAFLIADVRGYTAFTQERGDEEAGRLAGRFAQVTRSVVEAHRGRVLELRGDEALVVFGSPRSAIRGAVALQQRFVEETIVDPSLPLTVGIGLDAGEAVAVEGGYRGGALNVAARLCSLARAGEVLASREIVHLALRVDGVRFTERGQAELKGLDKPVHVVAVRSEERDDALAIAPFVRSFARPPRARWKAVAAVVAFAVVAALVAIPLVARKAGDSSEIEPNSVGVLDPESGEVVGTVGLEGRPGSVATSADAVWVTNPDVGTVTRIDPNDQEIRDSIPVGENPTGIAVGFDAVWVLNSGGPSVSRISPDTNAVVGEPIEVGNGPAGIAAGEGAVWVTNRFDGTISRIDPDTNAVLEPIPIGPDPRGIAVGFGDVWVALAGSNQVVRVDPDTNSVTRPIGVGNAPGSVAVSADAVWVVNTLDDTVSRINPDTDSVVDTIEVGDGPSGIAVVQGTVWVANGSDGTLSRIEPGQTPVSRTMIGSVPQGLAGVNGDLWVSVRGTATSHRGGTLRLVTRVPPNSLDPGNSYDSVAWEVLHLIGDGLVAFEPTGGDPVPDLATAIPTPTDGDLTYTFQLRRGIRYSNGEVVAPADFLRAFERGWRLNPPDHKDLYGRLVGAKACGKHPGACDLSEGIVTDDASGTITFHLVAPDPEFVYKLTIPFAFPVPPSVPDEKQAVAGVPGTGPYMLEAPMTDEGLTLVRNPHFSVWSTAARSDGYVDRIEWPFGVEPEAQVEAVAAGVADLARNPADASERLEDLFVRSPAQVHTSPAAWTFFAVLDTRVPPFDDVDVRRAVNLAIDRDRIVEILGGVAAASPTCQQLPPNFPGYEPYCPYTSNPGPGGDGSWTGSDMEEAERLVRRSGTTGSRVLVKVPAFFFKLSDAQVRLLEDYLIELLDDLGYVGSVERVADFEVFYGPDLEFDMVVDAWIMDYPAASNFITNRFTCDASYVPSARFCDSRIDALIDRATQMQTDDPAAAGASWAEVDRAIVDQAPYVWLVNPIAVEFVSERVGNYQYSQQWGSLLDQMWVR